jgi:NADH-quinone oxidoreductase subunit M
MSTNILSYAVFTPLIGALLVLLVPKGKESTHKYVAFGTALVALVFSIVMITIFDRGASDLQLVESRPWIKSLGVNYTLAVDGISVYLIPLTALLFFLGVMASWSVAFGSKGFFGLLLMLETTVLGTFCAQDLFLFFAFWQASLLPLYFLIGIWGFEDRVVAATRFFITQLAGSAVLFFALLSLYFYTEPNTFSLQELGKIDFSQRHIIVSGVHVPFAKTIFLLLMAAFAVRTPVFPLHGWFISSVAQAPTVISMIVAAIFIKTGVYGLLRISYSLFPGTSVWLAYSLAVWGAFNIIYGAICALGEKDLRKLVGFMSVSHMGFILVGLGTIASDSFHGAMFQVFSHGIYISLFVLLVGILGGRSGHFDLYANSDGMRGLAKKLPILTGYFTVAAFSSIGVPGLAGFPGSALVFLGTFSAHQALTVVGIIGMLMTAIYLLWLYSQVFLGREPKDQGYSDLTIFERVYLSPLVIICVVAGLYPTPFLQYSSESLGKLLRILQ